MKKHIYCISYNHTYNSDRYGELDRVYQHICIVKLDSPIISNESLIEIKQRLGDHGVSPVDITAVSYLGYHEVN